MSNRSVPQKATSGRPVIGHGMEMIITGCPGLGSWLLSPASFGLLDIGVGAARRFCGTKAIGARTLDFMAASTMDLATGGAATKAAAGIMIIFITTPT